MSSRDPLENLKRLGLTLPPPPKPVGSYVPAVLSGRLLYLSGQISKTSEGKLITGKTGAGLVIESAKDAARAAALNVISAAHDAVGLHRIRRLVRLTGYVQCAPDFYAIPDVLNAASDLFVEVFGENGRHARSAVGMASLPLNAAVELEAVFEVKEVPE